ncbi:reverse transcriptase domain-containing protein [Serratia ureilytica]|uniref:reverse transcriptase domain-containing protein n=1 Tax=Serratia ureilytica TaxID=300181 RepID=UPI00313BB50A
MFIADEIEDAWQEAYSWLCQQRGNAPANSDVWHLRFHWGNNGNILLRQVLQGQYRLSPMQVIHRRAAENIALWTASDALVLKWVALRVADYFPVHELCHHTKGFGCRHSLKKVSEALQSGRYQYVYRTDIRGYYRHMRKAQLRGMIKLWVNDPILKNLVLQFIDYSVEDGGEFITPHAGISRGCALSPILGAGLLQHIDAYFASCREVFYVRYMDDFLLLTETRWSLRRCIRWLNRSLDMGGFSVHPDKTQIGRWEKGFDWLGLWFSPAGTTIAPRALNNHRERCLRLYEQMRVKGLSQEQAMTRVRIYKQRWEKWATALQDAKR